MTVDLLYKPALPPGFLTQSIVTLFPWLIESGVIAIFSLPLFIIASFWFYLLSKLLLISNTNCLESGSFYFFS